MIESYDIELGEGDTDYYDILVKQAGAPVDLTSFSVQLRMRHATGTVFKIDCIAQSGAGAVASNAGGARIPFNSTITATTGEFEGKIYLVNGMQQTMFPTGRDVLAVRIWEGIPLPSA